MNSNENLGGGKKQQAVSGERERESEKVAIRILINLLDTRETRPGGISYGVV